MNLLARVRTTIRERGFAIGGQRVLVACSGGRDSAVLLHVLHRLSGELALSLHVASVNHGLRRDAERDVAVARTLAEKLGLPFEGITLDLKKGASLQARARHARYEALLSLAGRLEASFVAVGHTLSDQAETVLSRLMRGASVVGLAAIDPRRADGVIRPLIDVPREIVHRYAAEHELPTREDPSNQDDAFERVWIRNELLPLFRSRAPHLEPRIGGLADEAREMRALLDTLASIVLSEAAEGPRLHRARLQTELPIVQRHAVGQWLEQELCRPPRAIHVREVTRLLTQKGEVLLQAGWTVERDGAHLVLHRREGRRSRSG